MAGRFDNRGRSASAPHRRRPTWWAIVVAGIMVASTLGVVGFITASSVAPASGSGGSSAVSSPGPSTTLLAGPTETLVPTSGPVGTVVTLTGSAFNDSQIYYFCLETTNTKIGCPTTNSFTTTAAGAIPASVTVTMPAAEYIVIATGPLSGQYVVDAHFTLQTMDVLTGNVPYVIQQPQFAFLFTNSGPVAGSAVLNITLFLTETNLTYLEVLVGELNTPGTPFYHQYMTPSAFQKEFYPSNKTIAAIELYYTQHGFKVWSYSYSPLTIVLQANVTTIDAQFAVTLYNYTVNLEYAQLENSYNFDTLSNPVITNNADPSVPSTYASDITSIYGLSYASDIDLLKAAITACSICSQSGTPAGTVPGQGGVLMTQDAGTPTTDVVSGSSSLLLPAQLQSYYGITPLVANGYNGTGQKVGIIGVGENFASVADEIKAANTLGIFPRNVNIINLTANGLNTAPSGAEQELDLEMVEFTSPGAAIYDVQEAFNLSTGYHNSQKGSLGDDSVMIEIYYLLNVVDPNTITSSWGMLQFQHGDAWATTYVQMGLQATAEGVTYFEGSSDSHSIYYLIGEDSPYFVAVGGVDPVLSSTGTIQGQYAWYEPTGSFYGLQVGSGGGQSFFYPKPAYQVDEAVTVPANYINRTMPDISFPSNDVGYSSNGNSFSGGGGTSFSAPVMAGAFADMESMIAARYGVTQYQLGWVQPILYNLGYGTTYGYVAYNAVSYLQPSGTIQDGSYLGNGWNEWTGLGTPNMINMTYDFMNYIATEKLTARIAQTDVVEGENTSAALSVSNFGAPLQVQVTISLGSAPVAQWTVTVSGPSQSVPIDTSGLLPNLYTVSFAYLGGVTSSEFDVTAETYSVGFSETGLPAGTPWYVNGTTQNQFVPGAAMGGSSTNAVLNAAFTNGTIPYTVASSNKDYATTPVHQSILIAGEPATGPVFRFTPELYSVTFTETGLAPGTSWSITINGVYKISTNSTIVFTEDNATYAYSVATINGKTATPPSGTVVVHGATSAPTITFSGLSYTVSLTEVGLPASTNWSATVNGSTESSTTSTISFSGMVPGTYAYSVTAKPGYTIHPLSGNVTVGSGPVNVQITFTKITYPVTFVESGLPGSTMWAVTFGGVLGVSSTTSIGFSTVNGSGYTYKIASIAGYSVAASPSTVTVAGAPATVNVTFTPEVVKYTVYFTESGLPTGTSWSVTVSGGGTASGTTSTLSFLEANGTYNAFAFTPTTGYTATPMVSSVTVSGSSVSIGVTFQPIVYTITFTESGLPADTLWALTLNGVIASSQTDQITFSVVNGVYSYAIGHESGYTSATTSGPTSPLTVSGASVAVGITFTPIPGVHGTIGPSIDTTAWMRPVEMRE